MSGDLRIRAATSEDAAAITSLAFRSKAHWGYSLEFMAACKGELTYTGKMIDAPHFHFYVGEADNRLVAFYALEWTREKPAELEALFVVPSLIGTGVGKTMMEHCKRIARQLGIQEIFIQGDPNAESFYLSAGAQLSGYRESISIRGRQLPVFRIKL